MQERGPEKVRRDKGTTGEMWKSGTLCRRFDIRRGEGSSTAPKSAGQGRWLKFAVDEMWREDSGMLFPAL